MSVIYAGLETKDIFAALKIKWWSFIPTADQQEICQAVLNDFIQYGVKRQNSIAIPTGEA